MLRIPHRVKAGAGGPAALVYMQPLTFGGSKTFGDPLSFGLPSGYISRPSARNAGQTCGFAPMATIGAAKGVMAIDRAMTLSTTVLAVLATTPASEVSPGPGPNAYRVKPAVPAEAQIESIAGPPGGPSGYMSSAERRRAAASVLREIEEVDVRITAEGRLGRLAFVAPAGEALLSSQRPDAQVTSRRTNAVRLAIGGPSKRPIPPVGACLAVE